MKDVDRSSGKAFDFSQDAWAFRERLWKSLRDKAAKMEGGAEELEDDDLEWISAAGAAHPPRPDDADE